MIVASTALQEALLALKIAFLVLLYLFIWRIVRTVGRDLRLPQESFILRPPAVAGEPAVLAQTPPRPRLVVAGSPVLQVGSELELDSTSFTIGRGDENDISIDGDEFASARHVRDRAAPRRRLGARPRLDERHLRERRAGRRGRAGSRTATSSASARPS